MEDHEQKKELEKRPKYSFLDDSLFRRFDALKLQTPEERALRTEELLAIARSAGETSQ